LALSFFGLNYFISLKIDYMLFSFKNLFFVIFGVLFLGITCSVLNLFKFTSLFSFVVGYLIFFKLILKVDILLSFCFSLLFALILFFSKKAIWYLFTAYFISVESFLTIIFILIPVAAYSLLDRKIMALVQRRKGPNVVGL